LPDFVWAQAERLSQRWDASKGNCKIEIPNSKGKYQIPNPIVIIGIWDFFILEIYIL
jgi:hypothetical protein